MGERIAVMSDGLAPAGRHAAGALRPPDQPVRRRLHRQPVDELRRGATSGSATALSSRARVRRSRCPARYREAVRRTPATRVIAGFRPEHLELGEVGGDRRHDPRHGGRRGVPRQRGAAPRHRPAAGTSSRSSTRRTGSARATSSSCDLPLEQAPPVRRRDGRALASAHGRDRLTPSHARPARPRGGPAVARFRSARDRARDHRPGPQLFGDDPLDEHVVEREVVHRGPLPDVPRRHDRARRRHPRDARRRRPPGRRRDPRRSTTTNGCCSSASGGSPPGRRCSRSRPARSTWPRRRRSRTRTCAARRELEEETGHRAGSWRKLAAFWTAPGFASELMHLYLATDLAAPTATTASRPTRTSAWSSSARARSRRRWPRSSAARSATRRRSWRPLAGPPRAGPARLTGLARRRRAGRRVRGRQGSRRSPARRAGAPGQRGRARSSGLSATASRRCVRASCGRPRRLRLWPSA